MAIVTLSLILGTSYAFVAQTNEKSAVEATVRDFEKASAAFDFAKANSLLVPGARWIEHSLPEDASELPDWWQKAKEAGVRIEFRLRDFDIHIRGDVAWVTLSIDGSFMASNEKGENLLAQQVEGGFANIPTDPRKLDSTFVESEVLVKTSAGWRIALGHTSLLPAPKR